MLSIPSAVRDRLVVPLLMCLLLAGVAPVQAQSGDAGVARALQQAVARPAPSDVAPAARAALAFTRDPAVSARVRQETIRAFGRTQAQIADLDTVIGSGEMLREFDAILRRYGYDPTNLGDVLAAHLLIAWEVANDRDSARSPAGQRAVRRQLIGPLAAVPEIAAMSDAAKQAQAERTAYLTMVSAVSYQSLKRKGDRQALAALAAGMQRSLQDTGVDLQRLTLGEDGLVER